MSESFTSIALEVRINGTWYDIWEDVVTSEGVQFSRGIQGTGPLDRVAQPGTLRFTLNNSATNSAGLAGYYTPGHANARAGWTVGLLVRLSFTYQSWTYYKWRGTIDPDGLEITTGTNGSRRVRVTCSDWMRQAQDHRINLLEGQTDLRLDQAIEILLGNMPTRPAQVEYFDAEDCDPYDYIFDVAAPDTTALAEFQRLAVGAIGEHQEPLQDPVVYADGYIVLRGGLATGEKLWASFRADDELTEVPQTTALAGDLLMETGDALLMEDGSVLKLDEITDATITDDDILADSAISYGKHLANPVYVVTYPRKLDASGTAILWSLDEPIPVPTGGTVVTIRGTYNSPQTGIRVNGVDFVNPLVANTDYKATSGEEGGTDLTSDLNITASFGASEVELSLVNSGGTLLYTGGTVASTFLQVRGRGVYIQDPVRKVYQNEGDIDVYGPHPLTLDLRYHSPARINDEFNIGQKTLDQWSRTVHTLDQINMSANRNEKNMLQFLFLEPHAIVAITESMSGLSGDEYYLQGYNAQILDGNTVMWNASFKLPPIDEPRT